MSSFDVVQVSFRVRHDDGSESAATWQVPANANIKIAAGRSPFRVRFLLEETGGKTGDIQPEWRYSYNGGSYTLITAASSYIQLVASGTVSDGTATTQQLGAGTFNGGEFDSNGTMANESFTKSEQREYEGCFKIIPTDVKPTDTIAIRMYFSGGTQFTSYTNTPTLTIRQKAFVLLTGQ